MRIFLSGDENAARWHLPVAQAKVGEFVKETEKSGLKQNRFTFLFKETGAIVHAQYVFGQVSMQIHAPFIPMVEEAEETEEENVSPKTFWVNTAQGYFWVEVRYADGVPSVILTPFEAIAGEGWVYPGFALTAPGMISGTLDGTPESRYVLSQNGGVMVGVDDEKGTIKSTAVIDNSSRITVIENAVEVHDFVLIKNDGGQAAEVRRIGLSYADGEIYVERQYASIGMAYEGETNLYVTNLKTNPCWIHRKCLGSYFSPNKTIGYHVDIGIDDDFLGNLDATYGGDLLDNAGGFEESLFNHTPDLYRIAGLLAFPVSISGQEVTILLVAPTMGFTDDESNSKKCWGGYGLTQSWASCVDYAQDKSSWLLAPRFVLCTVNFSSGEKSFVDPGLAGDSTSFEVRSWDDKFGGSFVYETEYECDTDFYSVMETKPADDQCAWTESCAWTCDTNDPGSTGECPKGWEPFSHWEYFSRENLRNSKHAYFLFGSSGPSPDNPADMRGFYFMFDGLWHLDIGVFWTTTHIEGDYCGLCIYPYGSQEPGENVIFAVQGVNPDVIAESGHEYVSNMELVTPLGWLSWPLGGTVFGFVAKVPEKYEAPHPPVLMTGGIEYSSVDVEGEVVRCERSLMSAPCICEGNVLHFDEASVFNLTQTAYIQVLGGCAPYIWAAQGATFNGGRAFEVTDQNSFLVAVEDECAASISITDACGTTVSMSDEYSIVGTVSGPAVLEQGETGTYTTNLQDAEYTGTLILVEQSGNSAVLQMPEGASYGSTYTASWVGRCGSSASMSVTTVPECELDYDHVCVWKQPSAGPAPAYTGAKVLVINVLDDVGRHEVQTVTMIDTVSSSGYGWLCNGQGAGAWTFSIIPGYADVGWTLLECASDTRAYWHVGIKNPETC